MDNDIERLSTLFNGLKAPIIGLIRQVLREIGTTTSGAGAVSTHDLSGSAHSGSLGIAYVPDALDRNGSRTLVGNLTVGDGVLVDGVDISALGAEFDLLQALFDAHDAATAVAAHGSVGAHDHTTAGAGGDLTQYATVANLRPAYAADRLNKSTTAGAGLTGGGAHTADIDLAVGAGYGILVGANDVGVDPSWDFEWDAHHLFNSGFSVYEAGGGETASFFLPMRTGEMIPTNGSSYDVGSMDKKYRVGNFEEFRAFVFAELELHPVGGFIIVAKDQGNLGAPVLAAHTTIDFGKTMVPGDTVDLRTAGQYERMTVGSNVSGTTYNVNRNLDSSGLNDWNEGDVWVCFGQSGNNNGWIQMNGYDSPRLQMYKKGSAWDNDKELIRLGDLNGNWGYVASKFGLAIGEYLATKANIILDEDGILKIRNFNTTVVQLGADGLFDLVGTMKVSGTLSAASGNVVLDSNGISVGAGISNASMYKIYNGATLVTDFWSGSLGFGIWAGQIRQRGVTGHNSQFTLTTEAAGEVGRYAEMSVTAAWSGSSVGMIVRAEQNLSRTSFTTEVHKWGLASTLPTGIATGDHVWRHSYRCWYYYDGSAWRQVSVGDFTGAFPSSPDTNMKVNRIDFRAEFQYDGSAWQQTGVGTFASSFPSSPVDNLKVYRGDRDIEYFYNTATAQWLSTQIFTAPVSEVRVLFPYTTAAFGASDAVSLVFSIDNRSYGVRLLDTYIYYALGATNNGSNYWHYRMNYDHNDGGAVTDIMGTAATPLNTSALAASATGVVSASAATISANAKGGRVAVFHRTTGAPTSAVFRPEVKYRYIG